MNPRTGIDTTRPIQSSTLSTIADPTPCTAAPSAASGPATPLTCSNRNRTALAVAAPPGTMWLIPSVVVSMRSSVQKLGRPFAGSTDRVNAAYATTERISSTVPMTRYAGFTSPSVCSALRAPAICGRTKYSTANTTAASPAPQRSQRGSRNRRTPLTPGS